MDIFAAPPGPWDPSHRFETSWCLPPHVLCAIRSILALYAFSVQFFILGWLCSHTELGGCAAARFEFSYLTILSYWGLAFYFLASSVHTFTYARTGTALLDRLPRPLQVLHAVLYATVTVYPFVVTAVYWGKIYSAPWYPLAFDAWRDVSRHALNSALALFEIVVPRTAPHAWPHVLWLVAVLALYLGLAYITRATTGIYVYSFLDPAQAGGPGLIAAYVSGVAVGCTVVFCIVQGIIVLRVWVTEEQLGCGGKLAYTDDQRRVAGVDVELASYTQSAKIASH